MATIRTGSIIDDGEYNQGPSDESAGGSSEPKSESPKLAGFDLYSPGDIIDGGTDGGGNTSRRRGRPRGSKNGVRTDTSKTPQNIAENLERLLLSVHLIGSTILHTPELALDETEANKLASAIREVSKHYNVVMNPKTLALVELSSVAAMIYGTRAVAIYKRVKDDKKTEPSRPIEIVRKKEQVQTAAPATAPQQRTANDTPKRPLNPSDLFGEYNGVTDSSNL